MPEKVTYIDGLPIPMDDEGKPLIAEKFNAPESGFWLLNAQKQKLHIRYFLPENPDDFKCVLFHLHGYAAHVSSQSECTHGEALAKEGFAVFKLDNVGHGYSEGERAHVANYMQWIDDTFQMLKIVLEDGGSTDGTIAHFGIDTEIWGSILKSARFGISGQSLGGGLSIRLGRRIVKETPELSSRFIGAVLICPAIKGNLPNAAVLFILRNFVARIFPMKLVPNAIESVHVPDLIWLRNESIVHSKLDQWGRPGALGWGFNTRFGTGVQMILLLEDIRKNLSEVSFPFAVLHDPDDGVVQFEGTRLLLEKASTPSSIPRGRELLELKGCRHDLMTNVGDTVNEFTSKWLNDRLSNIDSNI